MQTSQQRHHSTTVLCDRQHWWLMPFISQERSKHTNENASGTDANDGRIVAEQCAQSITKVCKVDIDIRSTIGQAVKGRLRQSCHDVPCQWHTVLAQNNQSDVRHPSAFH